MQFSNFFSQDNNSEPNSDKTGPWQFSGYYPYQCRVENACEKDLLWFEKTGLQGQKNNNKFETYKLFSQRKGFCQEGDKKKQSLGWSFFTDNEIFTSPESSIQPITSTKQEYSTGLNGKIMAIKENNFDCYQIYKKVQYKPKQEIKKVNAFYNDGDDQLKQLLELLPYEFKDINDKKFNFSSVI